MSDHRQKKTNPNNNNNHTNNHNHRDESMIGGDHNADNYDEKIASYIHEDHKECY